MKDYDCDTCKYRDREATEFPCFYCEDDEFWKPKSRIIKKKPIILRIKGYVRGWATIVLESIIQSVMFIANFVVCLLPLLMLLFIISWLIS